MHEYISETHSELLQTSKIKLSANVKSYLIVFAKSFILGVCRVADSILGTTGYTLLNIQMERIPFIPNKEGIFSY